MHPRAEEFATAAAASYGLDVDVHEFPEGTQTAQDAAAEDDGATTYDFEDDLVTGDLVRPDGELLSVRRRGRRSSLIQIREHFIPEMLKSVEDL